MPINDSDRLAAETKLQTQLKGVPKAIHARYDRRVSPVIVGLDNGLELAFPPRLAQGLEHATPAEGWADVWKRGHFGWEYKGTVGFRPLPQTTPD